MTRLEYGQTPWDDMSREELLREMQRAYAAVDAARSALELSVGSEPVPFWRAGGRGYRALEMCEAVVSRVERQFNSEDVYRAFFRYAVDLLFGPEFGSGWRVCPKGHMLGDTPTTEGARRSHRVCSLCDAPMRDIEWRDIQPYSPEMEPKMNRTTGGLTSEVITLGTCSLCGGVVTIPTVYMSTSSPVPTCASCGAVPVKAKGSRPVIDMTKPC